jgi:hypothetical protein
MQKPMNTGSHFHSFYGGGQALVEYILMLAFVVALLGIINAGFKKSICGLWRDFFAEISAACPGCTPDPSYRFPQC